MIKYRGRKFNLLSNRQRLPNGVWAEYDMIQHPGAALIVPFLGTDEIILLRQYRPVLGRYLYEFPAGTLDPQESPLNCAKRELTEETGYSARRMILLGQIFPVPGYSNEQIKIYKAEGLSLKKGIKDHDEIIRTCIFSEKGIKDLLKRNKIQDAKTICALAFSGLLEQVS